MFIIIPLALILVSAGGIFFIVWRKLPHLKELTESVQEVQNKTETLGVVSAGNNWQTLIYDLCPEVLNWAKGIKIEEYKKMWLVETEKLLRRLRLVSLKMDRFSNSLIKKIRKRIYSGNGSTFSASAVEGSRDNQDTREKEDKKVEFKKNEQRLIIEIAKNPKNASFYEELGDLYAKMGDYRDAKESYEAAIELNSNNEELKKKLSIISEKLNSQS